MKRISLYDYDDLFTHTPRQIAEAHTLDDIESACSGAPVDNFGGAADLFGDASPSDWYDTLIGEAELEDCEEFLREWYDERDMPRPGTARDLAAAYQLAAAWQCKLDQED